jgi:predicted metal-dependent peptidase
VLTELTQPTLPWRTLLARFLATFAREDFSFTRPGRRSSQESGAAILPGVASRAVELVVALDTSGSIDPRDLAEFTTELDALKGQIRARVTLTACDAQIAAAAPWHFEAWERFLVPEELAGGGSTRFTPVFEWVEHERITPDALIYFTDAQGEFPAIAPPYPVLWLVKGNAPVPWGERVQLN